MHGETINPEFDCLACITIHKLNSFLIINIIHTYMCSHISFRGRVVYSSLINEYILLLSRGVHSTLALLLVAYTEKKRTLLIKAYSSSHPSLVNIIYPSRSIFKDTYGMIATHMIKIQKQSCHRP